MMYRGDGPIMGMNIGLTGMKMPEPPKNTAAGRCRFCPGCGKDFGNDPPKFCTECGTSLQR